MSIQGIISKKNLLSVAKICLFLFVVFLPWHGTITVFLPELFRFWKEAVLGILFFIVLILELKMWWQHLWPKNYITPVFAFSFLVWLGALVLFQSDLSTVFSAARYLGIGVFLFLIVSRLLQNLDDAQKKKWRAQFSFVFIFSCALSVLFGIWAQFFGGFEILKNFYSQTISSWVPGQTVPLYHEVFGRIRMQGASSGPIEFSHLLVLGLFLLPTLSIRRIWKYLFGFFLLFGIWESSSRAALFITVLLLLFFLGQYLFSFLQKRNISLASLRKIIAIFSFCIAFGISVFAISSGFMNKQFVQRVGTSDHFSRPLEAFQFGLTAPFSGHLGLIGPAARAKNLEEKNDDTALLAENVFVDVFAQTGVIGFLLYFGFYIFAFFESSTYGKFFLVLAVLLANMATIFDMTPISLSFFLVFAFFLKSDTTKHV